MNCPDLPWKGIGYPFRLGFFKINRHDFELISSQMLQKDYAQEN